jgi:hypothetical protein
MRYHSSTHRKMFFFRVGVNDDFATTILIDTARTSEENTKKRAKILGRLREDRLRLAPRA